MEEVIDIIRDYKSGLIILETDFEDTLKSFDKEELAQFIRTMTEQGMFDEVI